MFIFFAFIFGIAFGSGLLMALCCVVAMVQREKMGFWLLAPAALALMGYITYACVVLFVLVIVFSRRGQDFIHGERKAEAPVEAARRDDTVRPPEA